MRAVSVGQHLLEDGGGDRSVYLVLSNVVVGVEGVVGVMGVMGAGLL